MSQQFIEECLQAHNEYRAIHGSPPLVLNQKICQYSQNWAQTLASRNSLSHSKCHDHGYGENCAMASGSMGGRKSVDMFYEEIKDYDYKANNCGRAGHFTQVVWKASKELGVGRAVSSSGNVYVVCNYAPPGNFGGQYLINVLPPGSKHAAKQATAPTPSKSPIQPQPTQSSKTSPDAAVMPFERNTKNVGGLTTEDEMFSKMEAFRKEFEEKAKKTLGASVTFNQTQQVQSQIHTKGDKTGSHQVWQFSSTVTSTTSGGNIEFGQKTSRHSSSSSDD